MALYPPTAADRRVDFQSLLDSTTRIFSACGMADDKAGLLAQTLVLGDLRGIHSHGVMRVPDYVEKLTREGVDPRGEPRTVSKRGGALLVDGGNSMGQIGGTFAMRAAIDCARTTGIACAALRHSNHCGAMDWYARLVLAEVVVIISHGSWGNTLRHGPAGHRRHEADDRMIAVVQLDEAPDRLRVRAEASCPEAVADDDDGGRLRRVVLDAEGSTVEGEDAHRRKERRGDTRSG